jgi:cytochrome c-type biogenesis protein CcmH/NrfG
MDPQNIKAMYFRAFSLLKIEDFDQAVQCVSNLLVLQADHEEAKKLL